MATETKNSNGSETMHATTTVFRIQSRADTTEPWDDDIGDNNDCPTLDHAKQLIDELRGLDDDWAANDYRVCEVELDEDGDDVEAVEVYVSEAELARLNLWVDNQDLVNAPDDMTTEYIEASGWVHPRGVTLDGHTLSGMDPEWVWAAFRDLAKAVAAAGHGDDVPDDIDPPCLTACPAELRDGRNTSAAESLARCESRGAATYAAWMEQIE